MHQILGWLIEDNIVRESKLWEKIKKKKKALRLESL